MAYVDWHKTPIIPPLVPGWSRQYRTHVHYPCMHAFNFFEDALNVRK